MVNVSQNATEAGYNIKMVTQKIKSVLIVSKIVKSAISTTYASNADLRDTTILKQNHATYV